MSIVTKRSLISATAELLQVLLDKLID